jgi:hypothetical protein
VGRQRARSGGERRDAGARAFRPRWAQDAAPDSARGCVGRRVFDRGGNVGRIAFHEPGERARSRSTSRSMSRAACRRGRAGSRAVCAQSARKSAGRWR